jgi:acyl carrier protein
LVGAATGGGGEGGRRDLAGAVRAIVAEVLMVPPADVRPDSALVAELGAESIDFLDLIFRIEDVAGRKIPVSHWEAFVRQRLPGADLSRAITTAVVVEFAEREAGRER